MPTPEKPRPSVFYWDKDGRYADAAIHEPILAEGDNAKAEKIGRATAKRLGLTDAEIAALYGDK